VIDARKQTRRAGTLTRGEDERTVERSKDYVPKSVKINRWDMYREMAKMKDFEGMGFAPVEVTRAETAAAKAQRLAAQRVMFASAFPVYYDHRRACSGGNTERRARKPTFPSAVWLVHVLSNQARGVHV
jgi:hypothetical protein